MGMKVSKHFFFYATLVAVGCLGPLLMWDPFMCERDRRELATPDYAEDAKNSKMLFAALLCILTACAAPLADAMLDLWRVFTGIGSEKSPYTWNMDGRASAVYLAERLSVVLVFGVLAAITLEVLRPDVNYEDAVIYNVLRGGGVTMYLLSGGLFVSILHTSAEV
jgi:hypothetical protein